MMGDHAAGVTGRARNFTEHVRMWVKGVREGIVNRITPTTKNILYTAYTLCTTSLQLY